MKSLFHKNKLDIGVTRVLFKQVTSYSRNPLYGHLIIMGGILCPQENPWQCLLISIIADTFYLFNQRIFTAEVNFTNANLFYQMCGAIGKGNAL